MTTRNGRDVLTIAASAWILALLISMDLQAQPVIISETFAAGTVGNSVTFTVHNKTDQRASGVKLTPQLPLQWSSITGIKPPSATLEPGESIDFTIEFSVHADAPDGASDSITLFFDNDEGIKTDNPRYQINLEIETPGGKEPVHSTAYFVVLVQGSGYTFTYGDGTYEISGSEERFLVVHRGQSAMDRLEELKKYIDGDPCERTWAGPGGAGEMAHPNLFTNGSKITIIDGPYYSYTEFFANRIFKKNWHLVGKNGPHPGEMQQRVCQ